MWPPVSVERLWASKTDERMMVRIENVPFYLRGLAFGDIVQVRPDHERRELVYEKFVRESGHSTVQIVLHASEAEDDAVRVLTSLGCSWEVSNVAEYWAVDVPASVEYPLLRAELLRMKEGGAIGFQEGALSSRHRAQLPFST
jgi:hypothetical protein